MSVKAAEREILELATEDYQGLWEIRSQVEQSLNLMEPVLRQTMVRAVRDLLKRGWVQLYRASPEAWNNATALGPPEVAAILDDVRSWDLPAGDADHLLIAATLEGERAYKRQALG